MFGDGLFGFFGFVVFVVVGGGMLGFLLVVRLIICIMVW